MLEVIGIAVSLELPRVVAASPEPVGCGLLMESVGLVCAMAPVANDKASAAADVMRTFRTDKSPWGRVCSGIERARLWRSGRVWQGTFSLCNVTS